jgi:hypothetical protein
MPDIRDLINSSGKPLINEPKLIVLKSTRNSRISHELIVALAKNMQAMVVQLPMDSELIMGRLAEQELQSVHKACHAYNDYPDVHFTNEEITIIYKALCFLCEHTKPGNSSPEVKIMKSLKMLVAGDNK